ncbi:MAG: hypothetical protein AAGU19_09430 [Prolixibacteraceae bacterium]
MRSREQIVRRIFESQNTDGFWKVLAESDRHYPVCLHYVPAYKATSWTLILLADIGHDKDDVRIRKPLREIQNHFFDPVHQIFCLGKDHFPIPCLNGNMIYLDCYFNGRPGKESLKALDFFCRHQRFDDGSYLNGKNEFCSNTSCYGKHTCYWGVIKLLKGISFIPKTFRTDAVNALMEKCIRFILLHRVCYSSHRADRIMIKGMDQLSFPNMYKSDFLEILWLLKREQVRSEQLYPAIDMLKSKRLPSGEWNLERKISNMTAGVGEINTPNSFITQRAAEVLDFYLGF